MPSGWSRSKERPAVAKRFTITETEGRQRSFSYLVADDFPVGSWANTVQPPDELIGEVEGLGGSDDAPLFSFAPEGELIVSVIEVD